MFDNRKTATILAALRYWQREGLTSSGHEQDIATDGNTLTPLTVTEIDALCEEINVVSSTNPDVARSLVGTLYAALQDASSVVDAGDDEEYAYQAELESARAYLGIEETPASTPTGDFGLNAAQLEHKHGEEHPDYTREDWREEVENGDTRLGYWEWVMHQVESRYYDPCDNCGETDCEKMFAADHGYVCKACASDLRAPDEDDVAEWVGLHYKVNFDSEPDDRKADWIRRYTESMAA